MNKNTLRFVLLMIVAGLLLSGCQRLQKKVQDLNQNQNAAPTSPAQPQPTQAQLSGGASAAPSAALPTKAAVAPQTNSTSPSQSDQLLNDLDNSLNNLSNSLDKEDPVKSIP